MSLTSDDPRANDQAALPLFTQEGRRGFTHDLADMLIADLERVVGVLDAQDRPVHTSETAGAFHH